MSNRPDKINPYDTPTPDGELAASQYDLRTSAIAAAMTRIVVFPFGNILGLLEFFGAFGTAVGACLTAGKTAIVIAPFCILAVMTLDIWWRMGQPEKALWARLLSPYAGGCIFLLPFWLLFPLMFVVGLILALTPNPWVTR